VSVDLERRDHVALLTLNNPKALNALSPGMLDDLEECLEKIARDPGLRAVVITGAGEKAFCAGADIAHMANADPI
jgi:enoyl-CoA hydratase